MKKGIIKKKIEGNVFEIFYLLIFLLYFIRLFMSTTMFSVPWPAQYDNYLRLIAFFFVLTKIVFNDHYEKRSWAVGIVTALCFVLSWNKTQYIFLLDLVILIIGAKGVSFRKIAYVYLITAVILLGLSIIASQTGVIRDLTYYKNETFYHSLGIIYTTDFAAHVCYIVLVYCYLRRKDLTYLECAIIILLSLIVFRLTKARLNSLCLLLIAVLFMFYKVLDRCKVKWTFVEKIEKLTNLLMTFSSVIFCIFFVGLTFLYKPHSRTLEKINLFFTGRLSLGHDGIDKYGLSLFGTPFDLVGAGADNFYRSNYNFIDSSYVLILLRYGVILLLAVCIMMVVCSWRSYKLGNRSLLIVLTILSLQCMVEHHMLELAYNPFLLLIFSKWKEQEVAENEQALSSYKRLGVVFVYSLYNIIICLFLQITGFMLLSVKKQNIGEKSVGIVFIYFIISYVIAALLSVSNEYILTRDQRQIWKADNKKLCIVQFIGVVFGGFIVIQNDVFAFLRTIISLMRIYIHERQYLFIVGFILLCLAALLIVILTSKKNLRYLTAGLLLFTAASGFVGGKILAVKIEKTAQDVRMGYDILLTLKDTEALDQLQVYSDDVPFLYKQQSDYYIYSGLPLGKPQKSTLVFSSAEKEQKDLIKYGYLCSKMNEKEYVYAGGEDVVKAMTDAGIELKDYYDRDYTIDLNVMARLNGLDMDANSLIIDGPAKSIIHGPYVTIYSGNMELVLNVELIGDKLPEGKLANVRIAKNAGKEIVKEQVVTREEFDADGKGEIRVGFSIGDSESVEFLLFADDQVKMKVSSIRYHKIAKK